MILTRWNPQNSREREREREREDKSCRTLISGKSRSGVYGFSGSVLFVLGAVFFPNFASAAVVSEPYLSVYFHDMCHNPDLFVESGASGIASQHRVLGVIDFLNENVTSYASELTADKIASVSYLAEALKLVVPESQCCPGGYFNRSADECRDCGVWSNTSEISCLDAGVYLNGTTCAQCPDDHICPAGTNGRYAYCGAGYFCTKTERIRCEYGPNQCPFPSGNLRPDGPVACDDAIVVTPETDILCFDAGEYLNGTTCAQCPDDHICPAGTNGRLAFSV